MPGNGDHHIKWEKARLIDKYCLFSDRGETVITTKRPWKWKRVYWGLEMNQEMRREKEGGRGQKVETIN